MTFTLTLYAWGKNEYEVVHRSEHPGCEGASCTPSTYSDFPECGRVKVLSDSRVRSFVAYPDSVTVFFASVKPKFKVVAPKVDLKTDPVAHAHRPAGVSA